MGAAMNRFDTTEPRPAQARGRWQLILIVLMVIGPMILAVTMAN